MSQTQTRPIELYYWPTPNGWKITILFEELGVPYEVKYVNIGKGEQFAPAFLAISPNNRMPAVIDPEGPDGMPISVFESAAIMLYFGRKFGRFYPLDNERRRVEVEEWLAWQIANVGPVFGHDNHFRHYAPEKLPYAMKRFGDEAHRLYGVLDKRLDVLEFVAGDYSIADMALSGGKWTSPSSPTSSAGSISCLSGLRWRKAWKSAPTCVQAISRRTRRRRRSCSGSAPARAGKHRPLRLLRHVVNEIRMRQEFERTVWNLNPQSLLHVGSNHRVFLNASSTKWSRSVKRGC
jgi:GSH-dependent disulfide-bond oxidoreductase